MSSKTKPSTQGSGRNFDGWYEYQNCQYYSILVVGDELTTSERNTQKTWDLESNKDALTSIWRRSCFLEQCLMRGDNSDPYNFIDAAVDRLRSNR